MFTNVPKGVFWVVDGNYFITLPDGTRATSVHYGRVLGWMPEGFKGVYPLIAMHGVWMETDNHNICRTGNDIITEENLPAEFETLRKGDREFSNFLNMCYDSKSGRFIGYFRNNQLEDGDFITVPDSHCYFQQPDDLPLFARKGEYGY